MITIITVIILDIRDLPDNLLDDVLAHVLDDLLRFCIYIYIYAYTYVYVMSLSLSIYIYTYVYTHTYIVLCHVTISCNFLLVTS